MNAFNKLYNLILESIIIQSKKSRKLMIEKSNLNKEEKEKVLFYLEKISNWENDNKLVDFLAKFFATRQLIEDDFNDWDLDGAVYSDEKIKKIKSILKRFPSIDTQNYKGSLKDFLNEYLRIIKQEEQKSLDTIKQFIKTSPLFSQRKEYEDGVVIYKVEDSKEGMMAVRKVVDAYWGEDCNPWCLISRNKNGEMDDAWDYWQKYSAYPKHIAFQNGQLKAFCANDSDYNKWWDRFDQQYSWVPIGDGKRLQVEVYQYNFIQKHKLVLNPKTNKYDCFQKKIKIHNSDLKDGKLPVQFGQMKGSFFFEGCEDLVSLQGCPFNVEGDFDCRGTKITSLKGAPYNVTGNCNIGGNYQLKSLKYSPNSVAGTFRCINCRSLESLQGGPKYVGEDYICSNNLHLKSLKGAPVHVPGTFDCSNCDNLQTLEGAPKHIDGTFDCSHCWRRLKTLRGGPKYVGSCYWLNNCANVITLEGIAEDIGQTLSLKGCFRLSSFKGIENTFIGLNLIITDCDELKEIDVKPKEIGGTIYQDKW